MIELSKNISEYIEKVFGKKFLNEYLLFHESKYPTILRLSDIEQNYNSILESLKRQGIDLKIIDHIPNAFIVTKGEDIVGKTVEHTLGKYYIQSLSSMIPPLVLNPSKENTVLDLCAAPGSKSTQLAEMMEYGGTLYSNEPSLNRVKALVHNLDKMNTLNMSVIKEKGENLSKRFPEYFDKILVDAPCSALGVVQKKQEVSNWWSPKSVDVISSLQLKLLISAIKMAKVGAEIVYSTCTLTIEENEFIVDKVLKKYPVDIVEFELKLNHIPGYSEIADFKFDDRLKHTKRIIPWEVKSEGFFVAKLKKIGSTESIRGKFKPVNDKKKIVSASNKRIKKYLSELSNHFGIEQEIFNNYKYLINDKDINFLNSDSNEYDPGYFIRMGTKFGLIDKNDKLKLNSHGAQILGKYATKNIMYLNDEQELKLYFAGGVINRNNDDKGQKIVKFNDLILGTGVAIKKQLKSQFPRSKRTGSISIG